MEKMDWNALRAEYIAGGVSLRGLARKHSVPAGTVMKRAAREGWARLRADAESKSTAKAIQKTADAAADVAAKLRRAQGLAVNAVLQNLEAYKPAKGTRVLLEIVASIEKLDKISGSGYAPEPVQIIIGGGWDAPERMTTGEYLQTPEGRAKFPGIAEVE